MLTGLPQSPEVKYTWKMLHTTSLVLETCNGRQYNNPAKKSIYLCLTAFPKLPVLSL